jgi:predicted dehydrogenase
MPSVALVGCGHISQAHLRGWSRAPGCRVVGVTDMNRELASERARQFSVPKVFADLEEAIDAAEVLDVCTPPQTHFQIADAILRAGRKLVIEKPVVTTLSEWEQLRAIPGVDEGDITVVHNFKFLHSMQRAQARIAEGAIGDVVSIRHEFLVSPQTDRMLAQPHWSHSLPGGRWQETLPHPLYLTHFMAGPLAFDSVKVIPGDTVGAPATQVVVNISDARSWGEITFSATCTQNRRMITIQGTTGRIVVDWLSDLVTVERIHDSRFTRVVGRTTLEAATTALRLVPDRIGYARRHLTGLTPHTAILAAFGRYAAGQGPPPTPAAEVDYVVTNCDVIGREIDAALDRSGHQAPVQSS